MLEITIISALKDNYCYFLKDTDSGKTAIIDPSEATPIDSYLDSKGESLNFIFNTHHHFDHVGGNLELKSKWSAKIIASNYDRDRIPGIDQNLGEADSFLLGASKLEVLEIPGHTLGHIAFYSRDAQALFCGDTVFSLGCGRLFEGTPEMMFDSFKKIKKLPKQTKIYCGHEYTEENLKFAKTVLPETDFEVFEKNLTQKRQRNQPSIPTTVEVEASLNPFFLASSAHEFGILRKKKDNF